jgi:hypothetical protein
MVEMNSTTPAADLIRQCIASLNDTTLALAPRTRTCHRGRRSKRFKCWKKSLRLGA